MQTISIPKPLLIRNSRKRNRPRKKSLSMNASIELAGSLVIIGSSLELVGDVIHYKSISSLQSIKYLSFDTTIIDCLDYLVSLFYTSAYLTPKIIHQYSLRNPIYPTVQLSIFMRTLEFLKFGISGLILLCLFKYHHTKIKDQSFSPLCKCLIGINIAVFLVIQYYVHVYDSRIVKLIDSVDFLWFAVQQSKIFKYWPQFLINFGNSTSFHTRWLNYRLYGLFVGLIGKFILIHTIEWYDIPLNIYPFSYYVTNIPILIVLFYQNKWYNPAHYKLL